MARWLRRGSSFVAASCALWLLRLHFFGGVDETWFGLRVRSNDLGRPLGLLCVAVLVFLISGGIPAGTQAWLRFLAARRRQGSLAARVTSSPAAIVVMASALFAASLAFMTTTAGGSDASGYVSQADEWLHGRLKVPQPWVGQVPWPNAGWTFAPLGYKPVSTEAPYPQAPMYSPGLPLLMAAAKVIGGQRALFLVVPFCGIVLVVATYGIGRRVSNRTASLIAAWLIATSPVVLYHVMLPFSDVPAAAAWAAAFAFLLADRRWVTLSAGLLAGAAIVIRPNLAPLAGVMSLWLLLRLPVDDHASFRRRLGDLAIYVAGLLPGLVFVGLFYDHLFGSPIESGYGRVGDIFAWSRVWTNLQLYSRWAMEVQPIFTILGLLALAIPVVWARGNARRAMAVAALIVAAVIGEYLTYRTFDGWTYLRFLLPAWPFLAIGAGAIAARLVERGPRPLRWVVAAVLVIIGVAGVRTARDRFAFRLAASEHRYQAVAELVRAITDENSVVFSMEHSGALRYYSGRTPIRFDLFDPDWIDRSVGWLERSGVHAYAVLERVEVDRFRRKFDHHHVVDAVRVPIGIYRAYGHATEVYVFDLTSPPPDSGGVRIIDESDPGRWRNWPAGPPPSLVLHPADPDPAALFQRGSPR